LRSAVAKPITIGGVSVQVGISIGIAHTTDRLDAASVAAADRDLRAAKAERRARYRDR
jgi:GGDEF domain-containing protein